MQEISGIIEHIIFKNNDNGYCVLELNTGEEETAVVVGCCYDAREGVYLTARGETVYHPVYGEQFKADSYEYSKPQDIDGIRAYLASGAVPGVKTGLAARIIAEFGENSLIIMENEPETLSKVKGISLKKAQEISNGLKQNSRQREAVIYMQGYGITSAMALKIYEIYEDRIYHLISTNPYELADQVQGIGFRTADAIARKAGIAPDSDMRILSGILYTLKSAVTAGHIYLPVNLLQEQVSEILGIACEMIDGYIKELAIDKKIIIKKKDGQVNVYLSALYYMEQNIAFMLDSLNLSFADSLKRYQKDIERIEKEDGIIYDEKQRMAITRAIQSGVLIITGGPGTGKTTVLRTVIKLFEAAGREVILTAPTGRAAKRMSEATGKEASTIHRLLEVRMADGERLPFFEKNRDNPLEADVVIVDEMSMVDVFLMSSLLTAIPIGCRLILTGDANQLPSVGAGNVLRDLIDSGVFQTVTLDKIFRQGELSNIVLNAHRINNGEAFLPETTGKDFIFLERNEVNDILLTTLIMMKNKLPSVMKLSSFDIQVLSPMKKGAVGVEELNRLLQQHINPPSQDKEEYQSSTSLFREGDKVMQVKNNYRTEWEIRSPSGFVLESGNGIFNGDMGIVQAIDSFSKTMTIRFDDNRIAEYPFAALDELEIAYAVTVHKSQGSEYDVVILPLYGGSRLLLTRNILYTALTRAKTCVCVIGRAEVFKRMIENLGVSVRYSSLKDRIYEVREIRKNH